MNKVLALLLQRFQHLSPELFFLCVSGVVSLSLVFIMPPFSAPDERSHFMKAVQMSFGEVVAHKFSSRQVGAMLPVEYEETFLHYRSLLTGDTNQKASIKVIGNDILHSQKHADKKITTYENTAVYPPFAYIPQTLAVFITRTLDAPVVIQLYSARLATLVMWLFLVYFAIKILPFGKYAAVAFTLTPISFVLAASSSCDAIVFALCLLFISSVLALKAGTKTYTNKHLGLVGLLGVSLGLLKLPYMLLVLLVVIIPKSLFGNKQLRLLYYAGCIGGALLLSAMWMFATKNTYIVTNIAADTTQQLHYTLTNPLEVFLIVTNSLFFNDIADYLINDYAGLWHWMGIKVPTILMISNLFILALLVLFHSPKEQVNMISRQFRLLLLGIGLLGSYAIAFLIYLSFEPVRAQKLFGLNSRYFTPFLFLSIPIFNSMQLKTARQYSQMVILCLMALIIIAISTVSLIIIRFYV